MPDSKIDDQPRCHLRHKEKFSLFCRLWQKKTSKLPILHFCFFDKLCQLIENGKNGMAVGYYLGYAKKTFSFPCTTREHVWIRFP